MKKALVLCTTLAIAGATTVARADTAFSTRDYDLYAGDFDGDGLSDVLYIAHDPNRLSGIALSDRTDFNTPLQAWNNAYLGIPWTSGEYAIVVADFNGDARDDLFLQRRTPGDHYLLLTEDGGIGGISQALPNDAMGLTWSGDAHRVIAGDFNGDGREDLFLQPKDPSGLAAIVMTDPNGQFTSNAPQQTWSDGYAGFKWSARDSFVFASDFDGNSRADLLVQARPLPGTGIDSTAAVFLPNSNGVVLAREGEQIFVTEGVQAWSEDGFGAQWSPLRSVALVGDFNGDVRRDVLLQGLTVTDESYLLHGRATGAIFELAATLDAKEMAPANQTHVFTGRFSNSQFDTLYLQALDAAKSNSVVNVRAAGIETLMADASPGTTIEAAAPTAPRGAVGGGGGGVAALLSVTSAGRTPGQFAVSSLGGATYEIPLWTPPGARGIEPKLALTYASGGADGALGPGWSLAGLSMIARCTKTYASSNGAPAAVALTTSDDICLDGDRLRYTSGSLLVAGSVFQTEIADFTRVTAYGTAGNGPSYFIAEGKDGLYYEYGNTADSKAYTNGGATPYGWMLNKVRDRQNNNLIVTYSTTNGDIQPTGIQYTQTPASGGGYSYNVVFTYQNRVTNLSKYIAGGNILQTKVLGKVDVRNSGVSVRQYNLTYETAPTTQRDRLASVQECGGALGTDCLRATTIAYQNGTAGIAAATSTIVATSNGTAEALDVDGDGKIDLIYQGTDTHWYVRFANSSGGYGTAFDSGLTSAATLFGDFYGDGKAALVAPVSNVWNVARWNGSGFTTTSSGTALDTSSKNVLADTDGDGRVDLVTLRTDKKIYIRRNTSTGTIPAFGAATLAFNWGSSAPSALFSDFHQYFSSGFAGPRILDVNGDGRQDIVGWKFVTVGEANYDRFTLLLANGSTFSTSVDYPDGDFMQGFANLNNDQCSDLIFAFEARISACNGTATVYLVHSGWPPIGALDWDGDGLDDLLVNHSGAIEVQRSLGNVFATLASTGISAVNGRYLKSDSNGDGLADLVTINNGAGGIIKYGLHNGAATPADLAISITDGWNVSASPTYVPITQNNYTKYSDATFPDTDFIGPLYVVSQASQTDGVGGTFTNSLWYYGARVNRQGRGFEGFEKTRTQDSRNSLYHYVNYRRDYPYIGRVAQEELYKPDGTTLINRTANEYSVIDLGLTGCTSAISATNRCFPYVSRETVTTREITAGAPLISTSVTDFVYDNYGSPTSITTTTTDNDPASPFSTLQWQSVVGNTYVNDVANWCLGLPTSSTTQNTVPTLPSATRRVDHTVDAVNCRFTTETVEPLSATLKLTTSFGYAPTGCGNVTLISVVGLDQNGAVMPARDTASSYGTRCQFAESITNPLNEATTIAYNYNHGQKASITDPNGAVVSWLYDNFGRRTTETRPDSTSSTWAYSDCVSEPCWGTTNLRLLISETQKDSGAVVIRSVYKFFDAFERLRYDESNRVLGVWTNAEIRYNSLGLKQYVLQPYSSASNGYHSFVYDLLNRPTSDTLYNSSGVVDRVTSMAYAGLKTSFTDAKGNVTHKWSDVTGKLRRVIDPSPGGTTSYVFDPFGNLVQMTDASGVITSSTYNIRGFKTGSTDPDTGTWTYVPNSLNELVSQTDNKSQTITFAYDKLSRLTSRLEPESVTPTTFTYGTSAALHEIGRLKSTSKPDGYAGSLHVRLDWQAGLGDLYRGHELSVQLHLQHHRRARHADLSDQYVGLSPRAQVSL